MRTTSATARTSAAAMLELSPPPPSVTTRLHQSRMCHPCMWQAQQATMRSRGQSPLKSLPSVIVLRVGVALLVLHSILQSLAVLALGLGGARPPPKIVWWTSRLYPHWGTNSTTITCKTGTCLTTNAFDRSSADNDGTSAPLAFIFYGTDFEVEHLPLPRSRHHRWALLHEESPINNYLFSHDSMIRLFNYTATFRRESDYPLTTLFLPSMAYLTQRQPVSLTAKNHLRRVPQHPLAPVLYVQSHCDVASDRDSYVAELARHISIDSYGKCLNNRSLPEGLADPEHFESEAFLSFIANYKFHLAFENALCPDYITEKLFRALHVGSVPVYRGASNVNDWCPGNRSVILADEYASPEQLANFLTQLDEDDARYDAFVDFKRPNGFTNAFLEKHMKDREWGINEDGKTDFIRGFECFVCDSLLQESPHPKFADQAHMGCPAPEAALETSPNGNKDDVNEWIDTYQYSKVLADSIHQIIEANEMDSSQVHLLALTNIKNEL